MSKTKLSSTLYNIEVHTTTVKLMIAYIKSDKHRGADHLITEVLPKLFADVARALLDNSNIMCEDEE